MVMDTVGEPLDTGSCHMVKLVLIHLLGPQEPIVIIQVHGKAM